MRRVCFPYLTAWTLAAGFCAIGNANAQEFSRLGGIVQTASGRAHSCALTREGMVGCWGRNEFGQLGVGEASTQPRTTPVPVRGLPEPARFIAAGLAHSCAIGASGAAFCWGWNAFGQLGDGSEQDRSVATPVAGLPTEVVALSLGYSHSCALTRDGETWCWGGNGNGQLGDDSRSDRSQPAAVQALPEPSLRIDAGSAHSCAIGVSGSVRCWGANQTGQLGDGSSSDRLLPVPVRGLSAPARDLAAGNVLSCAIVEGGAVECWGGLGFALLGDGSIDGRTVAGPVPEMASGYAAIDAGDFHVCAADAEGAVRCFGDSLSGQLGGAGIEETFATVQVLGLLPEVHGLSAGGHHSCAHSRRGLVQCWGLNTDGQLGNGQATLRLVPTPLSDPGRVYRQVAGGSFHSCGLTLQGAVRCWGGNNQQQLGHGDDPLPLRPTPVEVQGLQADVQSIAVGFDHGCAISSDGGVKCWGYNQDGQLGDGSGQNQAAAVEVSGLSSGIRALALGRAHSCALHERGSVLCWGGNAHGQLGIGEATDAATPREVQGLPGPARFIAAGQFHSCAISAAGALYCWGLNADGQLGDGSRSDRLRATPVSGAASGVSRVALGAQHSCALSDSGAVACWGGALFGLLLGDGSEQDRLVPAPVPTLSGGIVELSLGDAHSCALDLRGGVRCWGSNFLGAIGDNSQISRRVPTAVAGLGRGTAQIELGNGHSCAVNGAGRVLCWGDNSFAQLGDGTAFGQPRPQTVVINDLARRINAVTASADGDSAKAALDATGRYVVFESAAGNLADGDDDAASDVFRVDRETGTVERVSLDDDGAVIDGAARLPALTGDGQRVLFVARDAAVKRVHGESAKQAAARRKGDGSSVYLRNMLTGTTQQVAPTSVEPEAEDAEQAAPQISAAGNAVVYTDVPIDPAQGTPGVPQVYWLPVFDDGGKVLEFGTPICVSCKSIGASGQPGSSNTDGPAGAPTVSADGQWVAWQTAAKNASETSSACPEASSQVLLQNMLTGSSQVISPPAETAAEQCGDAGSSAPSIDDAGSLIAFESDHAHADDDANELGDVYLWSAGALERVSVAPDGADPAGSSGQATISGDGSQIAFVSAAPNLDLSLPDNNDLPDVHVASLEDDAISRLSQSGSGGEADAAAASPALNFDGSQIAFDSSARLLGGLTGTTNNVFTRSNPLDGGKRSATWWLASESGWGITVFDQGSVLAPTWFTYDADGEPTWFIAAGAFEQPDGSYRGDLFRFTGTPFAQIDGPAAQTVTPVGALTLRYSGEDELAFDYSVDGISQSKTLRRFPFGARTFACSTSTTQSRADAANYTDLWTGAGTDAGWGLTLFHVDDLLVAIWYTYDTDGEAVFFLLTTTRQPDGSFSGEVFRQQDGTPFSAIDEAAPSPGADIIGSASLRFIDGETADFRYQIGAVDQTQRIIRLLVGNEANLCRSEDAAPQ
jgi:alpha-tubulin suppressor-like RCC1 family protein/Tol biopolymer transport system component